MILTWQKKGFFSGTYFLKDGDRTLWTYKSNCLEQTTGGKSVQLPNDPKNGDANGLTVTISFDVTDTQTSEVLIDATFQWNVRNIFSLTSGSSLNIGSLRCLTGETFDLCVQKSHQTRERFMVAKSEGKNLTAHGKKTIETNMDVADRMTAAVLLASIALEWRIGPFVSPGH